jgi:hypothetical protein
MALFADPRLSDSGRRFQERQVDDAYERSGLGFGLIVIMTLALGLLLLGAVQGLGRFDFGNSVNVDRTTMQPATPSDVKPIPRIPDLH